MVTKTTKSKWMLNTEAPFNTDGKAITSIVTENKDVICVLGETEEKFYNAHLLKTAPQLLEALELLLVKTYGYSSQEEREVAYDKARVAIASAKCENFKQYIVTLWRYPSYDRDPNAVNVSVFYFDEVAESSKQALAQAKDKFEHSVYTSHVEEK